MKKLGETLVLVMVMAIFVSCQSATESEQTPTKTEKAENVKPGQSAVVDEDSENHILKIALGSEDHTTLVQAVQAAGAADVLTSVGPLTVFAPTNEAFEKLPEGTVEELMKPENKAKLANIITFHAAPGNYPPNNIQGVMGIGQATGERVEVKTVDGVTTVNGAKVLASVKASNGYVHVIDQVLLPQKE